MSKLIRARLDDWAHANDVLLPTVPGDCASAYHLFYLLLPSAEQRQALMTHLATRGAASAFHYVMLYPLYFRRLEPDIITFFYSWQGEDIACGLDALWNTARTACVLSVQYPVEQVPYRYATLAASRLVRRARALVACSDYVADGVRACLGHDPTVITNGVDTDHFLPADAATRAAARREFGVPDDCPVYCTVAALEERKGVGRALEALALLKARGKRFRYLVVGDGPFRPRIEELIAAHDLRQELRLVGVQADLRPFYNACDVLLFLSHGEGAPLAPLEAMSCALPIIAADQPPLPAFLPTQGTIFVEDTSPASVLGALEALATDPARVLAMNTFNRAYAVRHYVWETAADNYERLFRQRATLSSH